MRVIHCTLANEHLIVHVNPRCDWAYAPPAGIHLDGVADHGVSEALYLRDPDLNGVELYWDRPEEEWPRDKNGGLMMVTDPLDIPNLLEAIEKK